MPESRAEQQATAVAVSPGETPETDSMPMGELPAALPM